MPWPPAFFAAALAAGFSAAADVALARGVRAFGAAASAATGATFAFAMSASVRPALASAARALPAAVWAPLALAALPAAMRALAAFAAAAVPVVFVGLAPAWTATPPRAAPTFLARRDLRRAAAFGWIAPTLAARSSAENASASEADASPSSWPVAILMVLETRVLARDARGPLMAARRSAWRTRFFPDGVRAPVQPRGE